MFTCTDQLGNRVHLPVFPPKRIVSLVPSQTELLASLGLDTEVVGITRYCVHPRDWGKRKEKIGGTKKVAIEKIKDLQPDLIIANKEENAREQIEALQLLAPVFTTDIKDLEEACDLVEALGALTGTTQKALEIKTAIISHFQELQNLVNTKKPLRACYLIWRNPYLTVGGDTFIADMLRKAGFLNIYEKEIRYPEIQLGELQALGCQILLLSSEPYPFREKHIAEIKQAVPDLSIHLVDGEMFSWYGSRLREAPAYFRELRERLA